MRSRVAPIFFLLPAFIAVGALVLIPLLQTVFFSMTNYNPAVRTPLTVGLTLERDEETGEVSVQIDPDGPAAKAGITPETDFVALLVPANHDTGGGERLEEFAGERQRSLSRMRRALGRALGRLEDYPPDERRLTLFVADGEASREVTVPFRPERVQRIPPPDLGIDVRVDAGERRLVIREGFPAARAGITPAEEIVALQGEPVSMADFNERLAATLERTQAAGEDVRLTLRGPDGTGRTVILPGHRGALDAYPPPLNDPGTLLFTGLHNYHRILVPNEHSNEARDFYRYLLQTVIWTFTNVAFHFVLGLALAILLNRNIRGRTFYRIVLMLPWAVPVFVSAFVWRFLFNQQGVINAGLEAIGLGAIGWLSSTNWTMTACIVVNVWLGVPFMMTVLLGGLQSIPHEMYEAATVDGATKPQQFWNVTLPLLKPVAVTATLLGVIWTFNMFNVIYLVQGREGRQVEILATLAFRRFYVDGDYGLAAAYGVVILAMLLVFALVYLRALRAGERVYQ